MRVKALLFTSGDLFRSTVCQAVVADPAMSLNTKQPIAQGFIKIKIYVNRLAVVCLSTKPDLNTRSELQCKCL